VRRRRLKQGRADAGAVAKQKRKIFLPGEVFFSLTCPLMGDTFIVYKNNCQQTEYQTKARLY